MATVLRTPSRGSRHVTRLPATTLRAPTPVRPTPPTERARCYRRVVRGLKHHLSLDEVGGVEIAMTPSGTDAEYLVLLLALGDGLRPLCNIVVGPREVGTGTEGAAGGYLFDSVSPQRGTVREPDQLDREAEDLADKAIGRGDRVLLHVVAHSKTGIHAPSLKAVRRLRARYGQRIVVAVDAAQGRVSRRGLVGALREEPLVLFTGSKFYGGAPFSGSVLVPRGWDPARRGLPPMASEFSCHFSRWEMLERWAAWAAHPKYRFNLGLLLRWVAGHEAARLYYEVPGRARFAVLRCFEDLIPRELAQSRWVELDSVEPVHFPAGEERLLESKTTVFPFRVRSTLHDPTEYFRSADLRRIANWLNRDISDLLPEAPQATQQLLGRCFHVGQPVFEGDARHPAVLRIALGAALVTEVGLNTQYGNTLDERLEWLTWQVQGALDKLHVIAQHFHRLVPGEPAGVTRCRASGPVRSARRRSRLFTDTPACAARRSGEARELESGPFVQKTAKVNPPETQSTANGFFRNARLGCNFFGGHPQHVPLDQSRTLLRGQLVQQADHSSSGHEVRPRPNVR